MAQDSIPVEVRAETPSDHNSIWHVNHEAFGRRDEADLVDRLRDGGHLHSSSVALHQGEVVGHAAISVGSVGVERLLVLAPVAVAPKHQGRGVGTAVVEHVLGFVADDPVSVVGEPAYYSRFGFEAAEPYGVSAPFPLDPGVLRLLRPERAPSGTITYPAPFLDL